MLSQRARATITQLDAWALEHAEFLNVIWESFGPTGRWPNAKLRSREMFASSVRLDVTEVARQMPPPLGRLETPDGSVVLTVRGLSYVAGAAGLVESYVRVLQEAIARYGRAGSDPVIGSAEFQGLFDLSQEEALRLEELVVVESWALLQQGGSVGDRRFVLDEHVVFVVSEARTVEEYLNSQANAWWPETASVRAANSFAPSHLPEAHPGPVVEPAGQHRLHRRVRRVPLLTWLRKHDKIRVVDWIAISAIATMIAGVIIWAVTDGPSSGAPAGSPRIYRYFVSIPEEKVAHGYIAPTAGATEAGTYVDGGPALNVVCITPDRFHPRIEWAKLEDGTFVPLQFLKPEAATHQGSPPRC